MRQFFLSSGKCILKKEFKNKVVSFYFLEYILFNIAVKSYGTVFKSYLKVFGTFGLVLEKLKQKEINKHDLYYWKRKFHSLP